MCMQTRQLQSNQQFGLNALVQKPPKGASHGCRPDCRLSGSRPIQWSRVNFHLRDSSQLEFLHSGNLPAAHTNSLEVEVDGADKLRKRSTTPSKSVKPTKVAPALAKSSWRTWREHGGKRTCCWHRGVCTKFTEIHKNYDETSTGINMNTYYIRKSYCLIARIDFILLDLTWSSPCKSPGSRPGCDNSPITSQPQASTSLIVPWSTKVTFCSCFLIFLLHPHPICFTLTSWRPLTTPSQSPILVLLGLHTRCQQPNLR